MKNILFLFTLLFFVACENENSKMADIDFMSPSSNVKLLGLDGVPIFPNDIDVRDLIKNPDDASDENMNNQLYDLNEAIKPLITDYKFNETILTLARKSDNNTVSFAELKKEAPNYYKRINTNLSPSSIDRIESQMVYNNPSGSKAEQYEPGIHIPNLKLADANRQPLLSSQLEYTGKDERMEEFILCVYNNGEAGFEGIWVGPHTADVTTNPIFVIDNLELAKKSNKSNIITVNPGEQLATRDMANTEAAEKVSNDIDYFIKQYKIAHRYDNSRRSEYSYELVYFYQGGGYQTTGSRTSIRNIHKNDINHLFYDNQEIWQLTAIGGSLASVGLVTFEHDWWSSNKTMFVGGGAVSCRTKYSSHWYQKFSFPYNGVDQSNNSKGYIKLESDVPCTTCPPGYGYDGANCYSGVQAPPGYNIFIWGTSFYVQQNCWISTANNCCPDGFGWDTANCHSGVQIPTGWSPFVWNRGFYVQPSCN